MRRFLVASLAFVVGLSVAGSARSAERVRFGYKAQAVDRTVNQTVSFTMELKSSTVQGNKTVEEHESRVSRKQLRSVTVLESAAHWPTKVKVAYTSSDQETKVDGDESKKVSQAVAGKTYVVSRRDKDAKLQIAYDDGKTPPADELDLVASSMDTIGRPNPLGEFLGGREVAIGETLSMSPAIAAQILGFDPSLGQVTKFELTLAKIVEKDGAKCGEFDAMVDLRSSDPAGPATRFRGKMVLEVATCRGVEAEFAGPVSFVENHGPAVARIQVRGAGALRMQYTSSRPKANSEIQQTSGSSPRK
jgi:hypothetical protein